MTNSDKRLARVYPALSARERGILTLVDSKEGRAQDHQLRRTAPEGQAFEFNRLLGVIRAASGDVVHRLLVVRELIAQTELRLAWLTSLRVYGLQCARIRDHLVFDVKEPVTQFACDQRAQESRRKLIPVGECAQIVAERYNWTQDDLVESGAERVPGDKAWKRVMRETAALLRSLVAAGSLDGRGKGNRLRIACGSFYDWLGEPVPVLPDFGIDVEVFADDQAAEVEGLSTRRAGLLDLVDGLAVGSELPFDLERPLRSDTAEEGTFDELQRTLAATIRAEVTCHWLELLTFELVIDEMTEEFGGEDVLDPYVRAEFCEAKAMLVELYERIQRYTGPFDLPTEVDAGTLAASRRIVESEARR